MEIMFEIVVLKALLRTEAEHPWRACIQSQLCPAESGDREGVRALETTPLLTQQRKERGEAEDPENNSYCMQLSAANVGALNNF